MSDQDVTHSDLVEIAKRNGDFRKNYGLIVGAILYLRSINAARPRLFSWQTSIASIAVVWAYGGGE
jgi:energy-converting hydrogenase Eha subunit A